MPYGYTGNILRVNLTDGTWSVENPGETFYRRYLGGGALATYYLLKEMPPKCDPLSPDNVLVFAAGLLTGAPASGMVRYTVAAKSPLTDGFGEAEAGGFWGPELKFAGFDAIVVKGRSPEPVYLWIHDGQVEIRSAKHLTGKMSDEAEDAIRQELDDPRIRIAQMGPAGEKFVRFANVVNNLKHFNGRTGMGAVMASKNLRAVAVRGKNKLEFADPDGIKRLAKWFVAQGGHVLTELGSANLVRALDAGGILPTRNFRSGSFEGAEAISGEKMRDTVLVKGEGCFACTVRCKRVVAAENPYKVDPKFGGPEYETLGSFGSCCGVSDLVAVCRANQLCGAYVADTISTGVTIAFAMECYENGLLTLKDTDGLDLRFGNADAMVKMVEKIMKREGLGDLLAEGSMRAARQIGRGAEQFAMHVKGQELPMHEPRGKAMQSLSFAVSPTGADHIEAPHDPVIGGPGPTLDLCKAMGIYEPLPLRDLSEKKTHAYHYLQNHWSAHNSMGICNFVNFPGFRYWTADTMLDLVQAVTGWDYSMWEYLKAGERATTMARLFNVREGLTSEDDVLPERLFKPLEGGVLKGIGLDKKAFEDAKHNFYAMMGWDKETGVPTREKLIELEIADLAE
ncbi:MAG: aldehyde ferredoxin oxidoreductase family protein [Chloroflexota bacterium]|jgi:aldehyde:ferredoxin oxidoreductase